MTRDSSCHVATSSFGDVGLLREMGRYIPGKEMDGMANQLCFTF